MLSENIKEKRILVVGDFMLDSYWSGSVSRISPEAPVPVFLKRSQRSVVGGAANVVANLNAAGQEVIAASVVGNDNDGEQIIQKLEMLGCNCAAVVKSSQRKTTVKTRLLAQNNQQLLRVDEEQSLPLNAEEKEALLSGIDESIQKVDAVILSDYLKGVLTQDICQYVIEVASKHSVPVFADIKDCFAEKYAGVTLVKPNKKELSTITGMPVGSNEEIKEACAALAGRCQCEHVLVTLGSHGMALYSKGDIDFIQCQARDVFDVSGAGDTVISYLVSCYTNGYEILDAAKIANIAAGIKVGKVGTATVRLEEMDKWIGSRESDGYTLLQEKKVVGINELVRILHNKAHRKVVFTNGCFDILHAGHVMYLQKAAQFGDVLIVGVNSDESVQRLKGPSRPINAIGDRTAVLAGLQCVSYIVTFDEDTPEKLIQAIKPNVLVKGADYREDEVVGASFVKESGGEIKLIPLLENRSTTNIIKKGERM